MFYKELITLFFKYFILLPVAGVIIGFIGGGSLYFLPFGLFSEKEKDYFHRHPIEIANI